MRHELEEGVSQAALRSGKWGLFVLAFVAVLREGIELALFLTAAFVASDARQAGLGGLLGLVTAVLVGWAFFTAVIRLDLRRFFQITSVLLILFAAGLVAQGVHELNEAGLVPSIVEPIWNLAPILDDNTFFGATLKALFGYNSNPSLTEVLSYTMYFFAVAVALRLVSSTFTSSENAVP
jgi:high-affinity iron transporter